MEKPRHICERTEGEVETGCLSEENTDSESEEMAEAAAGDQPWQALVFRFF